MRVFSARSLHSINCHVDGGWFAKIFFLLEMLYNTRPNFFHDFLHFFTGKVEAFLSSMFGPYRSNGMLCSRGGVKDTRLEAKYTKKSEAKSKDRPSEDRPLEAKGRNGQGLQLKTQRTSVLKNKKVFVQKNPKFFAKFWTKKKRS